MITYEYACTACLATWEADQRITDAPLTLCPACGAESAQRQVGGGAGFRLRGNGWARDGYSGSGNGRR